MEQLQAERGGGGGDSERERRKARNPRSSAVGAESSWRLQMINSCLCNAVLRNMLQLVNDQNKHGAPKHLMEHSAFRCRGIGPIPRGPV